MNQKYCFSLNYLIKAQTNAPHKGNCRSNTIQRHLECVNDVNVTTCVWREAHCIEVLIPQIQVYSDQSRANAAIMHLRHSFSFSFNGSVLLCLGFGRIGKV